MSLLAWRSEFSVGVPAVDFEHREMIELINEMHDGLGGEATPAEIADFLGEVYAKIGSHFALEERVMRERGYDDYVGHKADHARLLEEIREIMDEVELEGVFDDQTLAQRLQAWFGDHFRTKDARLHGFLN